MMLLQLSNITFVEAVMLQHNIVKCLILFLCLRKHHLGNCCLRL